MTIDSLSKSKIEKKALFIASMGSMLCNFNTENIKILMEMGYTVTIAANFVDEDSNSLNKNERFVQEMQAQSVFVKQIDFTRKILKVKKMIKSICQVKELLKDDFALVHCHSPICAAIVRILFRPYRKDGKHKIIYTAHGFHFYKGAPILNWALYYPIEKICSKFTDVLITINKEDYSNAVERLKCSDVRKISGVGVDTDPIKCNQEKNLREIYREKYKLPKDVLLLLSVGELCKRKNHEVIIRALSQIHDESIHYAIAGKGMLDNKLKKMAKKMKVANQVHFFGFVESTAEIYACADIYMHPSYREGLSVALMDAMASGLPCIVSDIRGNVDLIEEGKGGYLSRPDNVNEFKKNICLLKDNQYLRNEFGRYNGQVISSFTKKSVNKEMKEIYNAIVSE